MPPGIRRDEDDESLIRRIRECGDGLLFAEIFQRHSKSIYYSCLRVVRNGPAAEDLTQETFLRAFDNLDRYREDCFGAWLNRIARNLCLNWLRSSQRRKTISLEAGNLPHPVQQAEAERGFALGSALRDLPPSQRECLELFYYEDLSYSEITEKTGMPYKAVKTHLQNAMRRLRLRFRPEAP